MKVTMISWLDNWTVVHAPDWLLVKLGMVVRDIVGHLSQNHSYKNACPYEFPEATASC